MKILTLSEKEIKNSRIYGAIKDKHIVISITSAADNEITVPVNVNRVGTLFLKFDDVCDIDNRFIYFDRSMAQDILEFTERYVNQISMIVVQCQAGLSRSVAIGAALSKIINYADDFVYTKGIPNMFVYTTLLDCFFGNRYWKKEFSKISNKRTQAMTQYLNTATIRMSDAIQGKRCKDD